MSATNGLASLNDLVVGDNNEQAYKAVKNLVAQFPKPGVLLLHGPSGSGKTALLRAAVAEIIEGCPGLKMLWQSSEDYIRLLIAAIKEKDTETFKKSYIGKQLLVIDNIEDFGGKSEMQTGLAEIIANAYNSKAQVFIAANHYCKPLKVEALLREMIPDFSVVDLALPDQITLERAWISYGELFGLPCSTDYVDYFRRSEKVDNFWALNGLLQSYYTHVNSSFNEVRKS